ncbi:MAG TPA: 8-amino-7-oxononanoate synthase [Candidatus Angelobacter sp.]|nr:8-amino-7-oxononanoate synthase [Candidatus Angelobacter sp.]
MNLFDAALNERLASIREQGLYRQLRRVDSPQSPRLAIGGRTLLNFSSNDYLGLADEPSIKEAAIKAVEKFGAGSGASRLICGSLAPHHELEEALAAFKGTEAALTFSSGYNAALGTIGALAGKDDIIVIDKLVHASIVDAARLCGAKLRVFAHNDLDDLERILKWTEKVQSPMPKFQSRKRVLIVTESVFSMDGDCAPLREIMELKNKYGAWLMVDEAHATGLYGRQRRGMVEELGVSDGIEVQMGTLGKALGASGGFISGSCALIDFLVNRARSFIFSTASVPAAAAAACEAVRFLQSEDGEARRQRLWSHVKTFHSLCGRPAPQFPSAIIPFIIGGENEAVEKAAALLQQDIYVPAIRYPTVARGRARLRLTLTAAHKETELAKLAEALKGRAETNPLQM